jgi:hypothetical protein
MSTKKYYLGARALAASLLLLLASLQACQPAEPQVTGAQVTGTEVTGTWTLFEEDFLDPPNLAYFPGAGADAIHGRNMIFFFDGVFSDPRLDGKVSVTSNADGTYVQGKGIYGDWWGEVVVRGTDEKVIWEGNYTSDIDKEWNQSGTVNLNGYQDYLGLTATLTFTTTSEEFPKFTIHGLIAEDE